MTNTVPSDQLTGLEIAIVGMAGRFPGADDIDRFWENLRDGVESITTFSDEELEAAGIDPALLRQPNYVKSGAILDDVAAFDAEFFELSPREAELMDPQHRIFLECAAAALEHAGYGAPVKDSVGVYAGMNLNTYFFNLYAGLDPTESMGNLHVLTGNDKDYLTTRISYKLNLHGPSISVQTACSTSLVAVHLACRAVLSGECAMALAGGISIRVPQQSGYLYEPDGIYSPDGHCRAFDASAQGTTFGSGVGVVVLKRLEDALADGDTIHAVIKGSAINNDGAIKIGYTAPGLAGQADVIRAALSIAEIDADMIGYVEAHGTATPLGDPVEVAALTEAFRASTSRSGFCAIGSVKTNIGHLDTAAGVAGLIKTVQALKHRQIPPSLHFERPNPQIDFAASPFFVNAQLRDWPSAGASRRAGVSSFGVGGTNAHVILEEAPAVAPSGASRPWQLLALSAKTPTALRTQTTNLAAYLRQHSDISLPDVAYTLHVGRRAFGQRLVLAARDREDAAAALEAYDPRRLLVGEQTNSNRPVAWLFPGQGTQYIGMGRDLYEAEPVFRAQIERCAELLKPHLGLDLRDVLYPTKDEGRRTKDEASDKVTRWQGDKANETHLVTLSPGHLVSGDELDQTQYAQPALFMVEYALARLWQSWGVQPQAMIGHSVGEYVAACLAGVFSLEEAVALLGARGRLIQGLPGGAMLSVALSEEAVRPLIGPRLSLAAVNAPALCAVAGPTDAVDALQQQLSEQAIECRRLHTSHAFHSTMLEPILRPFLLEVQRVRLKPPEARIISNVTGTWLTAAEATDPHYWVRHLRHTVRFADGVATLLRDSDSALLEIGPGNTLISFARQQPAIAERAAAWSLPHPREEQPALACMLTALGKLWLGGADIDWAKLYAAEQRRRVPLPTYPFERRRYWVSPQRRAASISAAPTDGSELTEWFTLPSWRRSVPPVPVELSGLPGQPRRWLLFMDSCGVGARLVERLEQLGQSVTQVHSGERFARHADHSYTIAMREPEEYARLVIALQEANRSPQHIVHLWNVTEPAESAVDLAQDRGFYSLLFLAQALGDRPPEPVQIEVVSTGMQHVAGEDLLHPEKATSLGPCKVIPQEYPQFGCRSVDVLLPAAPALRKRVVDQLLAEFASASTDQILAYRGVERWVQSFEPVQLPETPDWQTRLRQGGVYLITGGLGGLGQLFASFLAESVQAKLVLLGRSALPGREEWAAWLQTHASEDAVSRRIRAVQALEQAGADVLVLAADVTDLEQMRAALAQAQARFGALHGVIHAAGVPGGGIIQLKTGAAAAQVLDPKVRGTCVLQALLDGAQLDFFVLFSSTIGLAGGVGHVDYCAANAFLDAFAHANTLRGLPTTAIDWDEWSTVGMAAEAGRLRPASLAHPLLDTALRLSAGLELFQTTFEGPRHWVLAEHRVMGTGTLPGTAALEMAYAAFAPRAAGRPVSMREVRFLQPLMVEEAETKTVYTLLETEGDTSSFTIVSRAAAGVGWHEHVKGRLSVGPATPAPIDDLDARIQGLRPIDQATLADAAQPGREGLVQWGPRWHSLSTAYRGPQQALAKLELPESFAQDVDMLTLHPALLDLATSYACLLTGKTNYLPLAYGEIRIYAPLPSTIYSYVRWGADLERGGATIGFDIVIADVAGRRLVEIDQFTLIADEIFGEGQPAEPQPAHNRRYDEMIEALVSGAAGGAGRALRPDEGLRAFQRIVCRPDLAQIVVAKRPAPSLLAAGIDELVRAEAGGAADAGQRPYPHSRSQTPYLAPQNERERIICAIWQQVLGVEQVGIHDNFFELGGHSLLAAQIVERLRSAFQLNVPLSKVVEAPTVAGLAQIVAELQAEQEEREALELLAELAELSDEEADAELMRRAGARQPGRE